MSFIVLMDEGMDCMLSTSMLIAGCLKIEQQKEREKRTKYRKVGGR
jgi:hypothetical protein